MSNNEKGNNENLQEEVNALREQVSNLMQLLNMQAHNNCQSSLDEEVTIICNMHGAIRVNFATWSLQLTEFGEKVIITKAQLQELVNNKRGYFKKQYILLDSQHIKLAESLKIPVYDSNSQKFIKPEDITKFSKMSVSQMEQYYEQLSSPMKKTFINYCYDKCCSGDADFYNADKMNLFNRLSQSRIFDNLIASYTRTNSGY